MPKVFSMIGNSWEFCRKQPAIIHIGFWFLFLPMVLSTQLGRLAEDSPFFLDVNGESLTIILLIALAFILVGLWGNICILLVGKRLLQAKAGRTRTSFKAVRTQARSFYVPYLLTCLLQTAISLLWMVLLIVPGLVYLVRTSFYPVAIIAEGVSYRDALNKSKDVVRGQFWAVLGSLILLSLALFIPAGLVEGVTTVMSDGGPLPILLAADIISGAASTLASILFLLTLIQLYGYFRPSSSSNH